MSWTASTCIVVFALTHAANVAYNAASVTFHALRSQALQKCQDRGHGWDLLDAADFSVAKNLLCQLNSIAEVNTLWRAAHDVTPYFAVIFARPDVIYNCPLQAKYLEALQVRIVHHEAANVGMF